MYARLLLSQFASCFVRFFAQPRSVCIFSDDITVGSFVCKTLVLLFIWRDAGTHKSGLFDLNKFNPSTLKLSTCCQHG
jgi:hypothetical protein